MNDNTAKKPIRKDEKKQIVPRRLMPPSDSVKSRPASSKINIQTPRPTSSKINIQTPNDTPLLPNTAKQPTNKADSSSNSSSNSSSVIAPKKLSTATEKTLSSSKSNRKFFEENVMNKEFSNALKKRQCQEIDLSRLQSKILHKNHKYHLEYVPLLDKNSDNDTLEKSINNLNNDRLPNSSARLDRFNAISNKIKLVNYTLADNSEKELVEITQDVLKNASELYDYTVDSNLVEFNEQIEKISEILKLHEENQKASKHFGENAAKLLTCKALITASQFNSRSEKDTSGVFS